MKVSIVIPARNEEKGIGQTLQSIPRKEIEKMGYELEVLVIDNNSSDKTVKIAKEMNAVVINEVERGYGRAYKTGLYNVSGDIIITGDADGTYPIQECHKLLEIFASDNIDFLTTNRFEFAIDGAMSIKNKIGNQVLSSVMRMLYGIDIKDSQSGMWIFKRSVLDGLKIRHNDWRFSQEIKIEVCYYGKYKWIEVPILYYKRIGKTHGGNWKVGIVDLIHLFEKRIIR